MAWVLLFAAIILEVSGTTCLKASHGLSKWAPSLAMFAFYAAAFTCLAYAAKTLEISIAYAIWAGLGTALIAVVGIVFFDEAMSWTKIASIVLIIIGVVGVNLQTSHGEGQAVDERENQQPER